MNTWTVGEGFTMLRVAVSHFETLRSAAEAHYRLRPFGMTFLMAHSKCHYVMSHGATMW